MRRFLPGVVSGSRGKWALFGVTEIPDHDDPTQVYLKRWRLIESPWLGVKLHNIRMSDNPVTRGLHDHPWSFLSIQLRGGYHELRPGPNFEKRAPTWNERFGLHAGVYSRRDHRRVNVVPAEALHAVRLDGAKPCWTLVINGPRRREWGFRHPQRPWRPWYELDGAHARNVRGHAGSTEDRRAS